MTQTLINEWMAFLISFNFNASMTRNLKHKLKVFLFDLNKYLKTNFLIANRFAIFSYLYIRFDSELKEFLPISSPELNFH